MIGSRVWGLFTIATFGGSLSTIILKSAAIANFG